MKTISPQGINGRIACRLCGSEHLRVLSTIGSFTAVQCRTCALVWAEPLPSLEELRKLYETGEIIEASGTEEFDESGHVIVPPWKESEVATMLELLDRHQPNRGKLLDVGCLWGIFLTRAVAAGWEAEGIEPWSKAADYCRDVEGLQVHSGILEEVDYGAGRFEAITLFDIIEHLRDPFQQLSRLSTWLRPGGCLVVSTPNYRGLLPRLQGLARRLTGRPWAHLTPPFHLYDFTPHTLRIAFRRAGLDPIETTYLTVEETVMSPVARSGWKQRLCQMLGMLGVKMGRGDRMVMVGRLVHQPGEGANEEEATCDENQSQRNGGTRPRTPGSARRDGASGCGVAARHET